MCFYTAFPRRAEPTRASALSRSESWYCCSGPRLFPHGPFSTTRSRDEPCSLLSGAPAHRGRAGFAIRAKWDAAGSSCLLRNKLRKAITSRVGPEWLKKHELKAKKHNTTSACLVNSHLVDDNPEVSSVKPHDAVKI